MSEIYFAQTNQASAAAGRNKYIAYARHIALLNLLGQVPSG